MARAQITWQVWVDTGGTFTDCIALDPSGNRIRLKVLSSGALRGVLLERTAPATYRFSPNWPGKEPIFEGYRLRLLSDPGASALVEEMDLIEGRIRLDRDLPLAMPATFEISANEEAPVLAARLATATPLNRSLPPIRFRLGSTKGTNALLERKGARAVLLITKGFADLIAIGTQQRPHLFQLDIPDPVLLYDEVIEIDERIGVNGQIVHPLTQRELRRVRKALRVLQPESIAIALLHAYAFPEHERMLAEAIRTDGWPFVSVSHELSPTVQLLPRAQTTLVNAYLAPVLERYLMGIAESLSPVAGRPSLRVMTSSGGLVEAGQFHPKDSLLSGPAGGVVGAARIGKQLGYTQILTLDMGGTSTDTSRYDGNFHYELETAIGGVRLRNPALAIETVAAGGGSICAFDGHRLQVGPESAGAFPGPACYGAGGPLTVTDVNLLLGKLEPSRMGIPIDRNAAEQKLEALRGQILSATGQRYGTEDLLRGLERIADEKMADAMRQISVAQGFDPGDHAMLVFGGAGGLHACGIADLLQIQTIILPYEAGLLSAYGIGNARVERLLEQAVLETLDRCQGRLPGLFRKLATEARQEVVREGFEADEVAIIRQTALLRLRGQDSTLAIPFRETDDLASLFRSRYEELFGHYSSTMPIEVAGIQVIAATAEPLEKPASSDTLCLLAIEGRGQAVDWDTLLPGTRVNGPAILINPYATAYLPAHWQAVVKADRNLVLERIEPLPSRMGWQEAIELELFANRFGAIAREMGAQLQRTAFSVNIKERLDFSCALLDPAGRLLVNAPHIPVHLGSLGVCARTILQEFPLEEGDVVLTNHPRYGGSHLPDLTMLSAVFTEEQELIGYVINRAHHAEIGGARPGSMPPDASRLVEEGVVIEPTFLFRRGIAQWDQVRQLLTQGAFPTRALEENLADLNAALASLRAGSEKLRRLTRQQGLARVHHFMQRLQETTAEALEAGLLPYEGRTFEAVERLDDGHRLCVRLAVGPEAIDVDFSGTSGVHPGNLNANLSIVHSALIYVLRLLCPKELPLNEGLMQKVSIRLPQNCLLHPDFSGSPETCPAVVGGNTEVSQRLVDTFLKALKLAACSQGTMNNLLFGNDRFGYYETIGGGAGAGDGFHGRSGVHQHMTNTRITDPETLELRYPVRLRAFALRRGSGGAGKWRGGDGIVRELEFLAPVELTLLSQHRKEVPYGMAGGLPGKAGEQFLIRADGTREDLGGIDSAGMQPGDRVFIKTPGGGGWGPSEDQP